ncbi:MAG: restriction endonuclease subunit S [Yonghaparkia sp.]|nr:restriction endonuclease subunit S [Microcella sp.]
MSRLDQLADSCLGKMLDKQKNRGTPRPYLRNINVRWGTFDLHDVEEMPFEADELERYSVRKGDLVVCEGGEPGRCAVWNQTSPMFIQKALHRVRCGPDLAATFLAYWLRHLAGSGRLAKQFSGTTIQHLPGVKLAALDVPHPPVAEQHRIVAAIETHFSRLDAAVASLTRARANVKRARASVLKAAVEGRLVPTEAALARAEGRDYEPAAVLLDRILAERREAWGSRKDAKAPRGRYREPVKPETEGLPGLPEGWCWASVEQLFNQSLGKMLDNAKNTGTLRPYLRNANVRWFGFDLSDTKMMRVEEHELERVSVAQGDIVVCEGGEPGRAAVWTSPNESFVIQKACHRLRPIMAISSPFFVIALRESAHSGRLAERFTGSTIKHLTGQNLVPFPLPLPPLAEQHRIVAEVDRRLSVLDALDATLDANLARCARLRRAVLKRAFEGRLVPAEADAPLLAAEPTSPFLTGATP